MPTITKEIADQVVAGKYKSDNPTRIVEYDNAWGGISYGLTCGQQSLNTYAPSDFVRSPRIYWDKQTGTVQRGTPLR